MKELRPDELPSLVDLESAAALVYRSMPPTPQYRWPLLEARVGTTVWVKHENHAPTGAFKVRGGLVYVDELCRNATKPAGVISATRGNHGQSVGFAARRFGIPAAVVVPTGNSVEKNAAMRALGVEVIERPVSVQDLFCTFCQLLGINPRREFMSNVGRPIKIVETGAAVKEIV